MLNHKKILIIAGSDSCAGAGIQADLKTAAAHKIYAATVITCLTAQNTKGVFAIHNPPLDFLKKQLEVLFDDISFDAIKIGMLGTKEIINIVAEILSKKAKKIPLILDSVMVATSGDILLEKNAINVLKSKLIKGCYIVTPNIDEAEILAEMKIKDFVDMKIAAQKISKLGAKNVLIKGGHLKLYDQKIKSVLYDWQKKFYTISNKKLNLKSLHGTGCTLACAIACNIAKENDLLKAVKKANAYVYRSIVKNSEIGKGSLVLTHF
jgi:hydroxymethylpyrimidine/phosphomethylpyrimidine kinase